MVNWYYVDGTERVGPTNENQLEELFRTEKINLETYVWRKGFANWERLKNVSELDFSARLKNINSHNENIIDFNLPNKEAILEAKNKHFDFELKSEVWKDTPKSIEQFSYTHLKENDSCFFIKIGHDRNKGVVDYFGPYSVDELMHAYEQNRINDKTLLFALGFDDWQSISSIPYFKQKLKKESLLLPINSQSPYYFVYEKDGKLKVLLIKAVVKNNAKVLTSDLIEKGEEIRASLFIASRLIKQNINLKVENTDLKSQALNVKISNADEEVKDLLKEFNE